MTTSAYPLHFRAILLGLILAASASACHKAELTQYQESRPLMGTLVDITTEGPDPALLASATQAAYAEMARLSDMMNHYNPDSVVSALNRDAGRRPVAVPRELMQVLTRARLMSERTGGAFDITVGSLQGWHFSPDHPQLPDARTIAAELPLVNYRDVVLDEAAGTAFLRKKGMRIDLGGIAKLYILDAGIHVLKRNKVTHAMINGGGDVEVIGTFHGRSWRIGIRDPLQPDRLYAAVEMQRGFVVSSGDYERYFDRDGRRYHHILDPKTGYPTQGPRAVTLISEDLDMVNGLSSSIMVLGMARGREIIDRNPSLEAIIFDRDGKAWVSPVLERRLIRPEQLVTP
jgi:thiamine biosynthesis lipoprotein